MLANSWWLIFGGNVHDTSTSWYFPIIFGSVWSIAQMYGKSTSIKVGNILKWNVIGSFHFGCNVELTRFVATCGTPHITEPTSELCTTSRRSHFGRTLRRKTEIMHAIYRDFPRIQPHAHKSHTACTQTHMAGRRKMHVVDDNGDNGDNGNDDNGLPWTHIHLVRAFWWCLVAGCWFFVLVSMLPAWLLTAVYHVVSVCVCVNSDHGSSWLQTYSACNL